MIIKASGRSALILATGLFVCFAGPSQAAEGADGETPMISNQAPGAAGAPIVLKKYTKSRHWKKYTQRKSSKVALNSANDKKAAATDTAASEGDSSTAIPPSIANANAQFASADTTTGNARAMSARANEILQSAPDNPANAQPSTEVVSADQLNDVDRALHESTRPAPALAMAAAEAPAATAAPVMAANSNESSTWDQTSLIGKIFIAFGGLLTLASAARMFMA
jgi:hypothetical protein